jgi:heme/copper-type cytochrome/quinol oxidase subunit 2
MSKYVALSRNKTEKIFFLFSWRIIGLRVLVNFAVLALLAASAYAVVKVVERSKEPAGNANWWRQNEITVVLTMITYIYPIVFEVLSFFEGFHPRKQLQLQLAR